MIANSGKAIVHVFGVGTLLMTEDEMHLVRADSEDPKSYKATADQVANAFLLVDGVHVTVREAIEKLPEIFSVPKEAVVIQEIYDEEPIAPPEDGQVY